MRIGGRGFCTGVTPSCSASIAYAPSGASAATFEKIRDDPECFLEAIDTLAWRGQLDAQRVVLCLRPPGAEPELEPTVGEQVDRRRLPREQRRMVERVVDHERPTRRVVVTSAALISGPNGSAIPK